MIAGSGFPARHTHHLILSLSKDEAKKRRASMLRQAQHE